MVIRTRLVVVSVLVQAASMLVCTAARAERPDENPPPQPTTRPAFSLDVTDLYMGFETDYQQRRVTSTIPNQPKTVHKNKDLWLRELVGLTLDGSVYDPNLLEYHAALEFGLSQTEFREQIDWYTHSDGNNGFLGDYDISLDALKTKPVSIHAYARHLDDRIPRRFLPSLREERTESGASLLAIYGPTTTEIGFSWSDIDQTGNRLDEDNEHYDDLRFYIDHKWDISETQHLRLLYDHERQTSTYQGSLYDFSVARDEVRLEHDLEFGPQDKHRLDTYFRYNAEQGNLARDELELVPRLTLQHTDKFRTVYRYGFYQYEQDSIEVNQHKFDFEALYTPTDRWRLSLDAYGLYEQLDRDVNTNEFGASIDVAYNRPTDSGDFSMDFALAYDQSRTTGDGGRRYVRAEARQLSTVRPVFLLKRGVIPGSILAYNANRTRFYVPGYDYTATIVSGRALVQRIPIGRIAEDEVVYFDYQYITPAQSTIDTYRTDLLIEHAFDFGLTPYYALEIRCQEVENSAASPWGRDNQNRHRFGARYGKDRWQVGAEYEIFYDSIQPYNAGHITGQVDLFRSVPNSIDLSAELSRYCFTGDDYRRNVWWFDVDLNGRAQINEYLAFTATTAYHWEDDSVDGDTNAADIECGLQFNRGFLTVELTVEYDLLSLARGRQEGVGFFLNVRRDLSHLLPSWRNNQ